LKIVQQLFFTVLFSLGVLSYSNAQYGPKVTLRLLSPLVPPSRVEENKPYTFRFFYSDLANRKPKLNTPPMKSPPKIIGTDYKNGVTVECTFFFPKTDPYVTEESYRWTVSGPDGTYAGRDENGKRIIDHSLLEYRVTVIGKAKPRPPITTSQLVGSKWHEGAGGRDTDFELFADHTAVMRKFQTIGFPANSSATWSLVGPNRLKLTVLGTVFLLDDVMIEDKGSYLRMSWKIEGHDGMGAIRPKQ